MLVLLGLLAATAWAAKKRFEYVQTQKPVLTAKPAPFAKVVGRLEYGDYVRIDKASGGWLHVLEPKKNISGWIHKQSLSPSRPDMSLASQTAKQNVDASEAAASVKPFTKDVESKFQARNKKADFATVDKMEAMTITREAMIAFLKAGKLTIPEGGAE
jgi:hypothetical protein